MVWLCIEVSVTGVRTWTQPHPKGRDGKLRSWLYIVFIVTKYLAVCPPAYAEQTLVTEEIS